MDLACNYLNAARGTDAYGDLLLYNNDLALCDGLGAITQAILQQIKFFRGEWFLDTTKGIAYLPELFTQKTVSAAFEADLQSIICSVPGVTGLQAWSMEHDKKLRSVTIKFRASTTHGEVVWAQDLSL